MDPRLEVSRVLGRYRGPWFVVWPATVIAAVWIFLEATRISRENQWEPIVFLLLRVAVLTAVWLVPQTIISTAGIDVERGGMFAGTRERQMAGRFTVVTTAAFGNGSDAQRQDWHALIVTLEQTLRLRAHRPGTLLGLSDYLHQRTGGMIGACPT